MPKQKTIVIEFETDTDMSLIHQVRNFGEDLWRQIEVVKLGSAGGLEQVDQATNQLLVTVYHVRKIGTVRALVAKLLKAHNLDGRSTVTSR